MHTMKQERRSVAADDHRALEHLGAVVRHLRRALGLSRAGLAERSGLSIRFLAQIEAGQGNISFLRLRRVAAALEVDTAALVEEVDRLRERAVALLGLRGAGKSTVGRRLAFALGRDFVEVDELVEEAAGMLMAQIFELQGASAFRRLEREVLSRLLSRAEPVVLATGGGVVTDSETYALLRSRAFTVWLRADPRDHWRRVLGQGDRRPMAHRPDAMAELERLWNQRAPLYGRADLIIDTSDKSVGEVSEAVRAALPSSAPSGRRRPHATSNPREN